MERKKLTGKETEREWTKRKKSARNQFQSLLMDIAYSFCNTKELPRERWRRWRRRRRTSSSHRAHLQTLWVYFFLLLAPLGGKRLREPIIMYISGLHAHSTHILMSTLAVLVFRSSRDRFVLRQIVAVFRSSSFFIPSPQKSIIMHNKAAQVLSLARS